MTEEVQQASTTPPATPAQADSPLDAVYKEYGIEDQAQQFQPQSTQPAAPQPQQPPSAPVLPKIPDPFSPEFQAYQAQIAQGVGSLHQALQETRGQLTAMQQQVQRERVEADIRQAVGVITEKAGIEPDIAEVALEAKARKDPKFLTIWNNRQKNPKAFQAALNAVATEFQQKYTVRQDPQLVENQRAIAASRQQMATTQHKSADDKWADMSYQERRAEVARIRKFG